jgi:hypothetical protein
MRTLDVFGCLDTSSFHELNGGLMVLLPKSSEATTIKDFRLILLIHYLGKLISKILANRLAPRLFDLVHCTRSAFIKGHYIQDNFRYVQAASRLLYARRKPCILFKVDLARALVSIAWPFLLEVLEHFGFSVRWWNWMSTILSTASTRALLNGMRSLRICHGHNLRQGDPLSPMLLILVLEVLGALIRKAD